MSLLLLPAMTEAPCEDVELTGDNGWSLVVGTGVVEWPAETTAELFRLGATITSDKTEEKTEVRLWRSPPDPKLVETEWELVVPELAESEATG